MASAARTLLCRYAMARPGRFGTSRLGFWLTAGLIAACGSKVIDSNSNDSDAGGARGGKAAAGSSGSAGTLGASAGAGAGGATGGAGTAGRGGASDSGAGTSGSGGSAGALGSNGSGGGAEAGARIDSPRRCGSGLPCTEGATCGTHWVEWGSSCECDPSGHFFCDRYVGGGAGGEMNCIGCGSSGGRGGSAAGSGGSGGTAGRTCQQTNGYCTMTCSCTSNDCTFDCSGSGPAPSEGTLCDPRFCDTPGAAIGGCSVKDGACDYAIECTPGGRPEITGSCE